MNSEVENFNELSFYTLQHPDKEYFIHQHIVDAYKAQTADENTKPIGLVFALVGLYLYLEKGYTGRQVQLAHMKLSENKRDWPTISLPAYRGDVTVTDVIQVPPGGNRDLKIKEWCICVWNIFNDSHSQIISYLARELSHH